MQNYMMLNNMYNQNITFKAIQNCLVLFWSTYNTKNFNILYFCSHISEFKKICINQTNIYRYITLKHNI